MKKNTTFSSDMNEFDGVFQIPLSTLDISGSGFPVINSLSAELCVPVRIHPC